MSGLTWSNSSKRLLSEFNFSVISCCDLDDKGASAEGAEGAVGPAMTRALYNNEITKTPGQDIAISATINEDGESLWIQNMI